MKIAFGIIVFNGNNTFEEFLKVIYPYASQILIAEGPVTFWQQRGYTTSTDGTNEMIDNFPDPEHKFKIVHSQYKEKKEQSNAYMEFLNDDIDYLWASASDQIFKPKDIEKVMEILENQNCSHTLVQFKSITFYGGFNRYLTGFEEKVKFPGLRRVYPGSYWISHRYPKIGHKQTPLPDKILDSDLLAKEHGIRMYHYSYVFPEHVYQKIKYNEEFVGKLHHGVFHPEKKSAIINNYFENVYLPWVRGDAARKQKIEKKYRGVHEFKPKKRGDCFTAKFTGSHPKIIQDNMDKLVKKFNEQLSRYK